MEQRKGFTLIEVLLVMIIIAILLGIAGLYAKPWMDKYRVESQTRELYVDLMNARVRAMERNRMHFVAFSPAIASVTRYTVYEDTNTAPDGNGTPEEADDTLIMQKNFNPIYTMTWNGANARIQFDTRGLMSGSEGAIYVTNRSYGAAPDCVVISASKIRIGVWNGANCSAQ